jgi:hypothetical protein
VKHEEGGGERKGSVNEMERSGKSERHLNTEREKEHLLVKNFPGLADSSFS